jgi:SAM-dependent methyltransferase
MTSMNEIISQYIQCPACRGKLECTDTVLKCSGCGESYPKITNRGYDMRPTAKRDVEYGFSKRWEKHKTPQATTNGVFKLKTGLEPSSVTGKVTIEGGCGIGRFLRDLSNHSPKLLIGLDASPAAIVSADKNTPIETPAIFLLADLTGKNLPVVQATVDLAYSIGVLHHTGNSELSFRNLSKTVKSGGELAVWVYCKHSEDPVTLAALEFLHDITKACPPEALYAACEKHAVKLRDMYKGGWGALNQVVRVSNSANDEECVSDTMDWHAPLYRHWHTNEDLKRWFSICGFTVTWVGEFPVSARGTRE